MTFCTCWGSHPVQIRAHQHKDVHTNISKEHVLFPIELKCVGIKFLLSVKTAMHAIGSDLLNGVFWSVLVIQVLLRISFDVTIMT